MRAAYYNEIEPFAAKWLRNLIAAGHIAPGDVDERDIRDVTPGDLKGYTQCHFFAGIGVWSRALRLAGWPDDKPVWTGSCPCQPFSAAGKGAGFTDERHLWPAWHWLISQCRPQHIFGEQVANGGGAAWLDLVSTDLEGAGYACGAVHLPACGVGAPHIRMRQWFVANSEIGGSRSLHGQPGKGFRQEVALGGHGVSGVVANSDGRHSGSEREQCSGKHRLLSKDDVSGLMADSLLSGRPERRSQSGSGPVAGSGSAVPPSTAVGFWSGAQFIPCRDGKARPVEPGPQQMVDGFAESLGRLRPEHVETLNQEIKNASIDEDLIRQALQDLWNEYATQAVQRTLGRCRSVQEAPVLLSFLRELSREGWSFVDHLPPSCWVSAKGGLRELRRRPPKASCSSSGREPSEQLIEQSANALSFVSQVISRAVEEAWMIPHPLAHGITGRVGRLRAYGNAIVAPAAAEIIRAAMAYEVKNEE